MSRLSSEQEERIAEAAASGSRLRTAAVTLAKAAVVKQLNKKKKKNCKKPQGAEASGTSRDKGREKLQARPVEDFQRSANSKEPSSSDTLDMRTIKLAMVKS